MTTDWKPVQARLKELGLYAGAIDGIAGPKTKAAVIGFQRMHGLAPDGIVGPLTMAALFPTDIPDRDIDPPEWPRQNEADMFRFYGDVGKNQTRMALPFPMRLAWDLDETITAITLHEKVHDSALRCFGRIADAYLPRDRQALGLDLFGGSLAVRRMRGGTRWSMHAWGAAIDFDPARNQLSWGRDRARLAQPDCEQFWRIWEDEGWLSLGRARNFDWMHVQAARL